MIVWLGHLNDIFLNKHTSRIRWLHCLQSTFHFLEFILKSATIDLNTTSGSGCNVRHSFPHLYLAPQIQDERSPEEHDEHICSDNYK